jgi:hypothetical protein
MPEDGAASIVKHEPVPKTFFGEKAFRNPCELMPPSEGEKEGLFRVCDNRIDNSVQVIGFEKENCRRG